MLTKIQKWGKGLGVRIPQSVAARARVAAGSTVRISIERGGLVVWLSRRREYRLADLLASITDENLHGEVDQGPAAGREVW